MSDWLFSLPMWLMYAIPIVYLAAIVLVCLIVAGGTRKPTPRPDGAIARRRRAEQQERAAADRLRTQHSVQDSTVNPPATVIRLPERPAAEVIDFPNRSA